MKKWTYTSAVLVANLVGLGNRHKEWSYQEKLMQSLAGAVLQTHDDEQSDEDLNKLKSDSASLRQAQRDASAE